MKYLLIVNPISGRGHGEKSIPEIEALFRSADLNYDLVRSEYPGHALELARNAAGYDVIISAGGDGTANEIINGILESNSVNNTRPTMAVIPVGRGNDFAYSMGIPVSIAEACQSIVANQRRKVDIGRVYGDNFPNGRYFGNGVGVGFDAVVGFEALKLKFLTGFASYIVAALKTMFLYFKAPKLQLVTPEGEHTGWYLMVSIMNGIRMGGGFYMAPMSNPSDGRFDLCVVNQVSRSKLLPLVSKFTKGTQQGDPDVTFLQTNHLEIQALEGGIPAHVDGETVCENGKSIRIELLPLALEMVYQPGLRV
ncbi:MAG: diacylglycerol kinase family protein [Leptolinea sp.]